jgi:hypothetical protein
MESTQNKLYEIEESACVDQNNLKNNYVIDEDLVGEENKNGKSFCVSLFGVIDYDVYADQFDDGGNGIMGKIPGRTGTGATTDPSQGIGAGTTKAQPDVPT